MLPSPSHSPSPSPSPSSLLPQVTFEATHHGPTLNAPAMFCEIGSSEEQWDRQDAAQAMADLFQKGLGLGNEDAAGRGVGDWAAAPPGTPVLVGLGGGHYAPRHGDVVRQVGFTKTRG